MGSGAEHHFRPNLILWFYLSVLGLLYNINTRDSILLTCFFMQKLYMYELYVPVKF